MLGSHAGAGILALPETSRGCEVIAVVDDFRIKEESTYFNVPLVTSAQFAVLAKEHPDLVAINSCENKKPKAYFNKLCWNNRVACLSNWQSTALFGLKKYFDADNRYVHVGESWSLRVRDAGDWLVANLPRRQDKESSVALIRLDGAGDFFIWLNAAKHLRQHYEGRKVALFCNSAWAEYAESLPYWDEVVPIDYKKFLKPSAYRWRMMLRLRFGGYATVLQPTYFRYQIRDDVLVRTSGSPERIGWHGGSMAHLRVTGISSAQYERSNTWYTKLLKPRLPIVPEIERDAEFASLVSGETVAPRIASLPARPEHAPGIAQPYCLLFPGASWHGRRWPTEKFSTLANQLAEKFGWHIVLGGSQGERPLCEAIEASIAAPVTNLAGRTNWLELVELIRGAEVLVSNETSAIHIAPAVDTPSVCILGGGHYGMFVPYPRMEGRRPVPAIKKMDCYGCGWSCTLPRDAQDAVPCIRDISVEDVFSLVCKSVDDPDDTALHPPVDVAEVFGITAAA